eukprot:440078-Pyramimonas_sp.AAC.1
MSETSGRIPIAEMLCMIDRFWTPSERSRASAMASPMRTPLACGTAASAADHPAWRAERKQRASTREQ